MTDKELNNHLNDWDINTVLLAKELHDYYEMYSQEEDWETNKKCKNKSFELLPIENQRVMLRIADHILNSKNNFFYNQGRKDEREEIIEEIKQTLINETFDVSDNALYFRTTQQKGIFDILDKLKSEEKKK